MNSPITEITLPQHVAIIMDGNGRWAAKKGLPRIAGHKKGAISARRVVESLIDHKVAYITLYVFSTENWNRPAVEIQGLFELLEANLNMGLQIAREKKIRILHLGSSQGLPENIQDKIGEAVSSTSRNQRATLLLAFNYGGRGEIVEAIRRIVELGLQPENIDESVVNENLYSAGVPDPDLIIRTGGEKRISNFLLWQAAYAEIYFTTVLWPDFNKRQMDKALLAYSKRQRRFGGLSPERVES
jgi:undecaprenyl diphosphate synthase